MNVEINDPQHCTFITQASNGLAAPSKDQSRLCDQCGKDTWAHTSRCMWCGFDTSERLVRLIAIGGATVVVLLTILTFTPLVR